MKTYLVTKSHKIVEGNLKATELALIFGGFIVKVVFLAKYFGITRLIETRKRVLGAG